MDIKISAFSILNFILILINSKSIILFIWLEMSIIMKLKLNIFHFWKKLRLTTRLYWKHNLKHNSLYVSSHDKMYVHLCVSFVAVSCKNLFKIARKCVLLFLIYSDLTYFKYKKRNLWIWI